MKHAQKMLLVPEQLLQSIETEHRLTTPPQLTTLTRLDRDMKSIMDSSLPEDQKVTLLDQLLQRYQGLSKQMKSESTVKPTVVLTPTPPATETTPKVTQPPLTSQVKITKQPPRKLPATPVATTRSKIPVSIETPPSPQEPAVHEWMMETPPDSVRKSVKRSYKARTPLVARLRSNRQWEPY